MKWWEWAALAWAAVMVAGAVAGLWLIVRSERVLRFRQALQREVFRLTRDDLDADREWRWRYVALDEVPYRDMVWSVRPLRPEVWWDDLTFLHPSDEVLR